MIQHCPTPTELDDLELLVSGAYAPLTRFNEPGSPVTLALPEGVDEAELVDPEGLPLARVAADGSLEPLTHAQYGPFRRLHLTPAQAREQHAGATFVPVADALTDADLDALRGLGRVVLVALMGTGTSSLSPVALVRATLAAADLLDDASVVAVPLPSHGDADADHALGAQVVATYAGDDPVHASPPAGRPPPVTDPPPPSPSPRSSPRTAPSPRTRAWCCSSPACPAAASRRWPGR